MTVAFPGFTNSVKSLARNAGIEDMRVATYPGVFQTHSTEDIVSNVQKDLAEQIIRQLTGQQPRRVSGSALPDDREIVFRGSFEEVNQHFQERAWSDGLPVVPPTLDKVEAFLRFTDRAPEEVLGVMHPSLAEASVWKVAVNGVMAGCRPEYMPILVAIVEAMADPQYGVEHAGSTPGWEAMVILNGPIARQLGFNCELGVQRPGNQANTSIGRFYRLFSRNVLGFIPGATDMATYGHMFRAVLVENDQACIEAGWQPLHVTRGFAQGDNAVTLASIRAMSDPTSTRGDHAEGHLDSIVDAVKRMIQPYQASEGYVETHVLLVTPVMARLFARDGYSKQGVHDYIMKHATVSARYFERNMLMGNAHVPGTTLAMLVEEGHLPKEWALSDDPERRVPLMLPGTQWQVVVTGDPTRARYCVLRQSFKQGYATSKKIGLPAAWDALLSEARRG